ncbi:MAG: carboxypeptidase regulatory-like domain-containing protein [Gemmatimonadaceae bacterium]|nr:carboxypeptidase regulatory-like domain-containing protein [Gemmatimonadaceae bacterium]
MKSGRKWVGRPGVPCQAAIRGAFLLAVVVTTAASAQDPDPPVALARVTGTVFDSVANRPLSGALVRVILASDRTVGKSATTDSAGRFRYDSLAAGTWLASFAHPVLDSLALDPPIARIDVRVDGPVVLLLATPSAATIIGGRCGVPVDPELGLLYGVVRSARDELAAQGASVSVEWPEWVIKKRTFSTELMRRVVRTDSGGHFVACGVPANSTLRALAWREGDSTGVLAVQLPPSGLLRQDFTVAPAELVAVEVVIDSTTRERVMVRRGAAGVTGRIADVQGRPISNAIVRVIGSGVPSRSGSEGAFRVEGAAAGTQTAEARAIGYEPVRQTVELRDGETHAMSFTLSPQLVRLDTVRVMAGRTVPPAVTDFERRWRGGGGGGGGGVMMSGTTVRERATIFVTDALRAINGVRVVPIGGFGQRILMKGIHGENCSPVVYVDGVRVPTDDVNFVVDDFLPLSEVAGLEVYARSAHAPPQFSDPGGGCGSVVVWSKSRFEGVEPRRAAPAGR